MSLSTLFKNLDKVKEVEEIWRLFYQININVFKNQWKSEEIRIETKRWINMCVKVYGRSFPTLYMHMLSAHLFELEEW